MSTSRAIVSLNSYIKSSMKKQNYVNHAQLCQKKALQVVGRNLADLFEIKFV